MSKATDRPDLVGTKWATRRQEKKTTTEEISHRRHLIIITNIIMKIIIYMMILICIKPHLVHHPDKEPAKNAIFEQFLSI
eukprot:COSAG06_NODE_594_length_13939_cov_45.080202_6_plen_80_part_00